MIKKNFLKYCIFDFEYEDTVQCLHCKKWFKIKDAKLIDCVIVCPDLNCDGNLLDFSKEGW